MSQICQVYIELSRNTPLLIQLYFGLPKIGIVLSSEMCAVVGLIFLSGSYMAESFRSGLEAISKTQYEFEESQLSWLFLVNTYDIIELLL